MQQNRKIFEEIMNELRMNSDPDILDILFFYKE
jgi:hypothetical protein